MIKDSNHDKLNAKIHIKFIKMLSSQRNFSNVFTIQDRHQILLETKSLHAGLFS